MAETARIGIDLGGTKIEGIVMDPGGGTADRRRVATPAGDYDATLDAIRDLVASLDRGRGLPIGVGTPGSLSPRRGTMRNANSTVLNGRPLREDLERRLGRPFAMANDADCFALSEATDGAAAGARCAFGVILGTGVGGGVVVDGRPLAGPSGIAGEWGHNPLPRRTDEERAVAPCWCGREGCIETFLSGPALAASHPGPEPDPPAIAAAADRGDAVAEATLSRYERRLARALASVINLLDPDVIVLGGGLSAIPRLYANVPRHWGEHVFSDVVATRLVPPRFGDSSGVRGAAILSR